MYPPEVVIAEKLHAMVVLDIRNSRMKDFYDLWYLARTQSFDLSTLRGAVEATFDRRATAVPTEIPASRWYAAWPYSLYSRSRIRRVAGPLKFPCARST